MKRILGAALFVAVLGIISINAFAQTESRDDVIKQIETKRAELAVLEKNLLAPSEEDRAAYADFLRQPNTGLIRLLPRETYDRNALNDNSKGLTVTGGGAYYSFGHLTHEYGYGSDIELSSDYLSVGGFGGASYGMLKNLGDLTLEQITLEHPSVRLMAAYNPAGELSKARVEQRRLRDREFSIDNERYQRRTPVEVNKTYLIRSINYDFTDVLVAFRVVRKDTDGSLIIAWKLLKNYPKPELIRNIIE